MAPPGGKWLMEAKLSIDCPESFEPPIYSSAAIGRNTSSHYFVFSILDTSPARPTMHANIFGELCFKHLHMKRQFTSQDVMAMTGITARQLQWWDERAIVVPAREGHRRVYSLNDLTEVAVICELRRRGFPLQRVRKVIRFLQREFGKSLAETVSGVSDYHLLTDGNTIYLEASAKQMLDVLKNTRQPILAICLNDTVRQVRADIRQFKKRNGLVLTGRSSRAAS
jgi:DNA-binding transcriptional MerR regulator